MDAGHLPLQRQPSASGASADFSTLQVLLSLILLCSPPQELWVLS